MTYFFVIMVNLRDKGAIEVMPFEACSDDSVLIIERA